MTPFRRDYHVPDDFEPTYETGNTRHMLELPQHFAPVTTTDTDEHAQASA